MDSSTPKKAYDAENLSESLRVIEYLEQLRLSAIRGNLDGVRLALDEGISVNQTLKGGWSPLLFAASMGHPAVVDYLLQQGADPHFHKEKFTALMAACASTRENEDKLVRCVELLIENGADIDAMERHRISALMFAAKEGHVKVVAKFIHYKCALNLQDSQGWTALFWAVNQGKSKVVEVLVEAGARVDITDRRKQTAKDLAFSKGLDEILNIFQNKPNLKTSPDLKDDSSKEGSLMKYQSMMSNDLLFDLNEMNNIFDERYEKNVRLVGSMKEVRSKHFKKRQLTKDQNSNCVYVPEKGKEILPWNTPYSLGDAVLLMKTTMKHLGVLYSGTSYVRLRLQGKAVDLPIEKKYTDAGTLQSIIEKALRQARILEDELRFLHEHVRKLSENDRIIPADVIVEKRTPNYLRWTSVVLVSAIVLLAYRQRFSIYNFSTIH
ncbi:ankyrin repeat, SAM and basic leucine zipper domain-containing protein 1 isoform X1 [Nilaparvata lugens]|uniref:ankyrin repeat, SAM and basic leucine zipper domain-containing protein 1 isoform X1 n=1 Tax=Nilaparvata lugens TaxID=108931 RepID=UPI00193E70A9|nr:ankyrin repeat, SAM and basic leucine zipper domain-containing protein 1 isoform X1 [Nilaparvata lugens]